LFERGAVYADRFPPHIRDALDVPDSLTEAVAESLSARRSVVISGNAGDGKSHLAQRALDMQPVRSCIDVTASTRLPADLPDGSVVFIRDVSALTNDQTLDAVELAQRAGVPLLVTINEGPLEALASEARGAFFTTVRDTLHGRTQGLLIDDPVDCLVVSLSGRQLARSDFLNGALDRFLPLVGPCSRCGKSTSCPRAVGARMLRRSKRGRERLNLLLQLLTDRGHHLSARDIWVFLIELFFGWTCVGDGDEISRAQGYFWSRVFESDQRTARAISAEFDPVNAPMAVEDILLWQGRFDGLDFEHDFPGPSPSGVARETREDGLRAFASAKRAFFFFSKGLDPAALLASQTDAPQFGRLLAQGGDDGRSVVREIVGLINHYRLAERTENDLWISRHHSMAAHRRSSTLAASAKLSLEQLGVRVPFAYEAARFPDAGFFPDHLLLHWTASQQMLSISFDTWWRLHEERSLTVDRDQEALDFALDLFMSQAPVGAIDDPEILVFDHDRRVQTRLRVRPDDRRIESL
jgi:hypothetical protein